MKEHRIKCESEYFIAHNNDYKMFEIRKNDRDYQLYDIVILLEVENGELTGRESAPCEITYIYTGGGYGLDDNYCVFQLREVWHK